MTMTLRYFLGFGILNVLRRANWRRELTHLHRIQSVAFEPGSGPRSVCTITLTLESESGKPQQKEVYLLQLVPPSGKKGTS